MLVGAGFDSLGDLAEAVEVELALEAGKLVLLEETTQDFGTQAGVIADLCSINGTERFFFFAIFSGPSIEQSIARSVKQRESVFIRKKVVRRIIV